MKACIVQRLSTLLQGTSFDSKLFQSFTIIVCHKKTIQRSYIKKTSHLHRMLLNHQFLMCAGQGVTFWSGHQSGSPRRKVLFCQHSSYVAFPSIIQKYSPWRITEKKLSEPLTVSRLCTRDVQMNKKLNRNKKACLPVQGRTPAGRIAPSLPPCRWGLLLQAYHCNSTVDLSREFPKLKVTYSTYTLPHPQDRKIPS